MYVLRTPIINQVLIHMQCSQARLQCAPTSPQFHHQSSRQSRRLSMMNDEMFSLPGIVVVRDEADPQYVGS